MTMVSCFILSYILPVEYVLAPMSNRILPVICLSTVSNLVSNADLARVGCLGEALLDGLLLLLDGLLLEV